MRSCAHILNLIVRARLSAIKNGIEVVRDNIAFWTATLKRVERFEEVAQQLKVPCTKILALGCVTWWNSTYIRLTTTLIYKDVLVTLNNEINVMEANMVGNFDKYWMVIHRLLAIATILDPRFKLKLIEYYFPKIYGNDSENHINKVRKICYDLVNEYQVKYSDGKDTMPMVFQGSSMEDVHERYTVDHLATYDLFVSSTSNVDGVNSEFDYYLEEPILLRAASFDIIAWWRINGLNIQFYSVLLRISWLSISLPLLLSQFLVPVVDICLSIKIGLILRL
ncbi:hypothetical protein Ddye_020489 [Dipteronia dyeriana]|uniref:hAT-like transposase RNase-H fold domain-containing protein n=1 Tax=Dipteronia dyeriana TaxID=168575 RepID=A0AAD9TZT4_9ROSI|nr:hypothetical protein Ddye_020489 [Dipteronia dyeriana]